MPALAQKLKATDLGAQLAHGLERRNGGAHLYDRRRALQVPRRAQRQQPAQRAEELAHGALPAAAGAGAGRGARRGLEAAAARSAGRPAAAHWPAGGAGCGALLRCGGVALGRPGATLRRPAAAAAPRLGLAPAPAALRPARLVGRLARARRVAPAPPEELPWVGLRDGRGARRGGATLKGAPGGGA